MGLGFAGAYSRSILLSVIKLMLSLSFFVLGLLRLPGIGGWFWKVWTYVHSVRFNSLPLLRLGSVELLREFVRPKNLLYELVDLYTLVLPLGFP